MSPATEPLNATLTVTSSHQTKLVFRATIIRIFGGVLLVSVYLLLVFNYLRSESEKQIENLRHDVLVQMVGLARNAMEPVLVAYRAKELSKDEALTKIRDLIRKMTYRDQHGENYFFLNSFEGKNLVHPFNPARELANDLDLKDVKGKYLIREMIEVAKSAAGTGFVTYHYYPPRSREPEDKLTYVVGVPELGIFVGTGTYLLKAQRDQAQLLRRSRYLALISLLLSFLPVGISLWELWKCSQQLTSGTKEAKPL